MFSVSTLTLRHAKDPKYVNSVLIREKTGLERNQIESSQVKGSEDDLTIMKDDLNIINIKYLTN